MRKQLSKLEVFSIVLGAIIGWGAFMLPGSKFLMTGGIINTSIGLLLGALCIIGIEQCYHIMMQTTHEEGGEYSYVFANLGSNHGFVVGWFLSLAYLTMIPLNASAFPLVINKLSDGILNIGYLYTIAGDPIYLGEIAASALFIAVFMFLNIKGIKETGRAQLIIISGLIFSVIIVSFGMFRNTDLVAFKVNYISNYEFDLASILKVFAITPFLYVGFDAIPQLVTNLEFNKKKATMLAVISLMAGMAIYILLNLVTGLAYAPSEAAMQDWALGSGVIQFIGFHGFLVLVIALSAAVSSGINGFMICSSQLMGTMGRKKTLPAIFGGINKNHAYHVAIKFVSMIAFIAIFFGRAVIIWIVDMSSIGAAIAYLYVCYVTYRLYKKEKKTKIKSVIGMIISLTFILLLLLPFSPGHLGKESLIALIIWCVMGFLFWRKTHKN